MTQPPLESRRRSVFIVALLILAQLAVLGFMAAQREHIVRYGERLFLRTAPVDPRDPFRGDYVRLGYPLNLVSENQYQGRSPLRDTKRAQRLYATLEHTGNDVYDLQYLSDQPPADSSIYIAGRNITSKWAQKNRNYLDIKYGIEKYFVEQGKGKKLEQKLGRSSELQIPMEVEIALGAKGTAVITGYRWSRLGIKLEFAPAPENAPQTTSPSVTFIIENVSDTPLTLATDEHQCTFFAEVRNQERLLQHAPEDCSAQTRYRTVTLQPNEILSTTIDFNHPRWQILQEGKQTPVHQLSGWNQIQLVYQPPVLEGAWQGRLRSPRFTANRRID